MRLRRHLALTVLALAGVATPALEAVSQTLLYRYRLSPEAAADKTPDTMRFGSAPGTVSQGSPAVSDPAVASGFVQAPISISGGEYSIDGGEWTASAGTIRAGQAVRVRVTAGAPGETRNATLTVGTLSFEWSVTTPFVSCSTPWGQSVAHGSAVTAFTQASVPFGSSCSSYQQTRSCSNGNLSGSASNASCSAQAATYSWNTGGFGSCSATCGGGTQSRSAWCQRSDGATVADFNCSGSKPSTSQSCNTQACASKTCGAFQSGRTTSNGNQIDQSYTYSQSSCKTWCEAHPSIRACIYSSTGLCTRMSYADGLTAQYPGSSQVLYAAMCY